MLGGIITVCGGALASSAFIVSRKPQAKEIIDKLTPYEGFLGLLLFSWGVWEVFCALTNLALLTHAPVLWSFWLAVGVADLLVGFLLGFKLLSKYLLSRNAAALAKGKELRLKLTKYQIPIGLLAIAMGTLYTVWVVL